MQEPVRHSTTILQQDAMSELLKRFADDLCSSTTFINLVSQAMSERLQDLASSCAENMVQSLGENLDAEDIVSQSSALEIIRDKLIEYVDDAAENVCL